MSSSTTNNDSQWTFGPFFDAHLKSPVHPLPDWHDARQHFGPLFVQLHLQYAPELMAATKTTPPATPVFPPYNGFESELAHKRRLHLIHVEYFVECCDIAMESLSKHGIHFDGAALPKALRLLFDEVPRLRIVLSAIRDICDPPAPAPTENFTRVPVSALFHGAKLAEQAKEYTAVHRGTTPTESELFTSSDEDEEIQRITGAPSLPSSPSPTEAWEANQEEAYRPASPECVTPPESDLSSDCLGVIGSTYSKKAQASLMTPPSSLPSLSPTSATSSPGSSNPTSGSLSPSSPSGWQMDLGCEVFEKHVPEATKVYYGRRNTETFVQPALFDSKSTYVDPAVLLALDPCQKARTARLKLEEEAKIRKMAEEVRRETTAIMQRNLDERRLMEAEDNEEEMIELVNSLRRGMSASDYLRGIAAARNNHGCPNQCC